MGKFYKMVDLSTDEKKKSFFELLDSKKSMQEIYEEFNLKYTPNNSSDLKILAKEVGFDLFVYKERQSKPKKYCLQCGRELIGIRKKFCSSSCAATYNNSRRTTTTKGKTKLRTCIRCGKEFYASIHINKHKCICEDCKKHNRLHSKNKSEIITLKDISKRTFVKTLKRMNVKCSICGWNESTCDVHHINPKQCGGTDDFSNLIVLCPNCHRICHTTNKYSKEFLAKHNLEIEYGDWREFYHPSN